VGAWQASDPTYTGKSYVIFGGASDYTSTVVDYLGDATNHILNGTSANEQFIGGAGDDTLIGNGGKDVMYGGMGNDTFTLNVSNIAALSDNSNSSSDIMRINGGGGVDTLIFDGNGVNLDFTSIRGNKVINIEKIDLTGSGDNSLTLNYSDLLHLSDSNTLFITGNAGDIVTITDQTIFDTGYNIGQETVDGINYDTYQIGGTLASDIWVQNTISVYGVMGPG
jgi:hypothetical protein